MAGAFQARSARRAPRRRPCGREPAGRWRPCALRESSRPVRARAHVHDQRCGQTIAVLGIGLVAVRRMAQADVLGHAVHVARRVVDEAAR